MQRWFFDGDGTTETVANQSSSTIIIHNNALKPDQNGRLHTFRVLVNQYLDPNERVAVTGECSTLGHWMPAQCVQLNRENGKCVWVCVCGTFVLFKGKNTTIN